MTQNFNRRDMLKSASSLFAATTLGGLLNTQAMAKTNLKASQARYVPSRAFASIDQVLKQAIVDKTAAGAVVMAATETMLEAAVGLACLTVIFG